MDCRSFYGLFVLSQAVKLLCALEDLHPFISQPGESFLFQCDNPRFYLSVLFVLSRTYYSFETWQLLYQGKQLFCFSWFLAVCAEYALFEGLRGWLETLSTQEIQSIRLSFHTLRTSRRFIVAFSVIIILVMEE